MASQSQDDIGGDGGGNGGGPSGTYGSARDSSYPNYKEDTGEFF
jgi:hypothetical protein